MENQQMRNKLEQFLISEFSEISKRYENYDPKTRSLLFLDKLHLIANFIATAIVSDEIDNLARREKEQSDSCNNQTTKFEALRLASNVFKNEINALEKHILEKASDKKEMTKN